MTIRPVLIIMLHAVLMTCVAANESEAAPILAGGSKPDPGASYTAGAMNGFDFELTSDQFLTALGFWDGGGDGLLRSFQVGLWEVSTQTLLASATIDDSDPLDSSLVVEGGSWRYETLASPVPLTAGTIYTLTFHSGSLSIGADDALILDYATIVPHADVVLFNTGRFLSTSSFVFPTNTRPADTLFRAMVNAQLSPIPEPASMMLLGLGLAALGAQRWRQRRKR